ncbi:hypothetical protein LPB85_19010 [Chryseobacterium sp. LC2016-27]|uniref:hypothetical protein n=1 Tax=Chryseobacterium sp. LC2016-27 TaxID=2897326 RepID=UPI001E31953E|nr:hypothetical protein [Chryseobacterium sp. LC2016-27]MCD0457532.1 hypothetical protein [Chryseobacterium sp. LC2016-27]
MQKDKDSISPNVVQNTRWKLGFFFSLFLILTSNHTSAFSEKISSENVIDSSTISSVYQSPETVIHIAEGTTVYGINNFSHTYDSSSSSIRKDCKKHERKKIKVIVHTKSEVQFKNRTPKPKITTYASKYPSGSSFQGSNEYIKVGTITTVNTFKSAELIQTYDLVILILYNKKFYCIYSFPSIKSITDRYSFTRPPPVLLS